VVPLRLILFFGLVFHKLLWEAMKKRDNITPSGIGSRPGSIWFVKFIKIVVLFFLAVQTLFLDLWPISGEPSQLRLMGTAIFFLGLVTAIFGRVHLGKNWVDFEDYRVLSGQSLVTTGVYRFIRHPIYDGDILLLVGLQLALNS